MRIDCRIFAVREEDLEELKASPASVLGRSLLAGVALCDLKDMGPALRLILSGPNENEPHPANCLTNGGTELTCPASSGPPPRWLSLREVQALNTALKPLTEPELQRRFNYQNLVSAVLERISAEMMGFSDPPDWNDPDEGRFPESEEDFVEDWTLEQADEFERIAQQIEDLKAFVWNAARQRQALVIAIRETE
jgi:hypothetical protein